MDYIITFHDCFNKCSDFSVKTVSEVTELFNLEGLISSKCKPPDHSIVSCTFQTQSATYENESLETGDRSEKKYRFKNVPADFMNNEMWRLALIEMIDNCSVTMAHQSEIDQFYDKFVQMLCKEMDMYLQYSSASKRFANILKLTNPFGTKTLQFYGKI